MLETIERIEHSVDAPLCAQPNAGRPRDIEGRTIYLSSPEYMASYARRFVAQGVRLVGGCCGTTPEHIRQMKLAVQALAPTAHVGRGERVAIGAKSVPAAAAPPPPVPRAEKSRLASRSARGTFVLSGRFAAAARPTTAPPRSSRAHAHDPRRRRRPSPTGPGHRPHERALARAARPAAGGIEPVLQYAAAIATCSACSRTCSARTRSASATSPIFTGDPRKSATTRTRARLRGRLHRPHQRRLAANRGVMSADSRSADRPHSTSASSQTPPPRIWTRKSAASSTRWRQGPSSL